MTRRRTAIVLALVVVLGAFGAYRVRNPERLELDAAARQQAPGRFLSLGDGVTHYEVAGPDSGQRVVLVHGFSVPSYIWDSTSIALAAAGFRVARYDTYGRGYSDRPDVAYSFDLFDRQLVQLLDSLGWRDPVDLIGLSFGGPVSAGFAGRHPHRTRSLTLIDPAAGPSGSPPSMFHLPIVGPLLWQVLAVPGMADGQLGDFVEPAKWPDWPERYRTQMRYRGFGRALLSTRRELAAVSLDSVYSRVGALGTPTLLIWGAEDQVVPITLAPGVLKAIPQAEYHQIEQAGHLPHLERAPIVDSLLARFLRRAPSR